MATIFELIERAETEEQDNQARAAGFMVGVPGEVYTRSLNKNSMVFIERFNGQWQAWRETYQKDKPRAISFKVIAAGNDFLPVVAKAKRYFNYIKRKREGKQ